MICYILHFTTLPTVCQGYVLIYRNTCPTECEATSSLAVRAQPLWRPLHGERRVGDRLLEISLGDVFYPQSGDHSANVSYRNQTWLPGKNFRAGNVLTTGFRIPLKFW